MLSRFTPASISSSILTVPPCTASVANKPPSALCSGVYAPRILGTVTITDKIFNPVRQTETVVIEPDRRSTVDLHLSAPDPFPPPPPSSRVVMDPEAGNLISASASKATVSGFDIPVSRSAISFSCKPPDPVKPVPLPEHIAAHPGAAHFPAIRPARSGLVQQCQLSS